VGMRIAIIAAHVAARGAFVNVASARRRRIRSP
jgi:hypothetical protein